MIVTIQKPANGLYDNWRITRSIAIVLSSRVHYVSLKWDVWMSSYDRRRLAPAMHCVIPLQKHYNEQQPGFHGQDTSNHITNTHNVGRIVCHTHVYPFRRKRTKGRSDIVENTGIELL